jgi:hypothetical protein
MKILIASTPATGHLNPLLAIGRILMAEGHEVAGLSANAMRGRIEEIGAEFHPCPPGAADFELRDITAVSSALKHIPPGPEGCEPRWSASSSTPSPPVQVACSRRCAISGRCRRRRYILSACCRCCSRAALETAPSSLCGTSILHWRRPDRAPMFTGLPPATTPAQLLGICRHRRRA